MELDLNRPGALTLDQVAQLLGAMRATRDRIIVCRDGVTSLASDPHRCERAAFVIDLDAHNRTPHDASDELAHRVFACLRNNWPVPRDVYLR